MRKSSVSSLCRTQNGGESWSSAAPGQVEDARRKRCLGRCPKSYWPIIAWRLILRWTWLPLSTKQWARWSDKVQFNVPSVNSVMDLFFFLFFFLNWSKILDQSGHKKGFKFQVVTATTVLSRALCLCTWLHVEPRAGRAHLSALPWVYMVRQRQGAKQANSRCRTGRQQWQKDNRNCIFRSDTA